MACSSCSDKKKKSSTNPTSIIKTGVSNENAYVRSRLAVCSLCESNQSGICSNLKEIKPDDDCDIIVGVQMEKSYCPAGHWGRHDPQQYPKRQKCIRCGGFWNADNEICKSCVNRMEIKRRNLDKGIGTSARISGSTGNGRVNAITKEMQDAVRNTPNRSRRKSAFTALYSQATFLTVNDLANDAFKLSSMIPPDVKAIVGVARSGMTPANIVATMLHLPLLAVRQTLNDVIPVGNGWRMGGSDHVSVSKSVKVAVIDDTSMTGNSFRAIKPLLERTFDDYVTCSVYVNPLATLKPDIYCHELPWPHLLEWNLFNSVLSPNCATDFDGVLCHDCAGWQDDDGDHYLEFIKNAIPKYLSRKVPIPLIVTARIEKYRQQTEDWLERHGVKFNRLVMHPAKNVHERRKDDIAAFKAHHFEEWAKRHHPRPRPSMFIESEPHQSKRINEITNRLVLCPSNATVYGDAKK